MVGIDIGRACVAEDLAGEARQRCRVLPTVGDAEVVEVALVELGAALAGDEVLDMEGRERLGRRVRFANEGRQGEKDGYRSEERRVGKECVGECRYRRARWHLKKKKQTQ